MQQSGRLFWRNGFVCGCRRQKAELRFFHAGYRCLLMAKGSKHSLRLLFFAAFWSAKSGAKTDPPTKKAERRGLTLAPGARLKGGFKGRWAAERIISDTTLSLLKPASYAGARAFSRAFVSRLRHRAGVVRRETRREGCVRDKQKAQKPTIAPKGGGWGERNGSKKPAGCRAANNPRRSSGRSQGLGRTKRLKGPAVAGLRRSLPPKDSDTPRARTAECFMYSR